MVTIFCVRPSTPNIGNDLIYRATKDILYAIFGSDASIVNVPAMAASARGGLTAAQVYDMNRFADGVVVGGGNLFENGQLTVDRQALDALHPPLMLMGLSHGRIDDGSGRWAPRTDAMPAETIRQLAAKACVTMVRDAASQAFLNEIGVQDVALGGCPSLFLAPNASSSPAGEEVLLSIRHPSRMSVPPPLQWRTAQDVRRLIDALRAAYGDVVRLVCHDYMDLEFAAGFPDVDSLYFDDVERYIAVLRSCRLSVSYRLHAFLPCAAFGVPAVHLSYDERGESMAATAGMAAQNVNLLTEPDIVGAVLSRARSTGARLDVGLIDALRQTTLRGVESFARVVNANRRGAKNHGH
jgi:polysaccharide pyruvyl transferase WcaK-like protein